MQILQERASLYNQLSDQMYDQSIPEEEHTK